MSLIKKGKLGNGIYGTVYLAQPIVQDETKADHVAVKRNFADFGATWIWSVREMNMMMRLKGHPFIVNLISPVFRDPFSADKPMTPINEKNLRMKEDKVHFVMEYVETPCDKFILDKQKCTPTFTKLMITQFLLGIEYMHSQNVTHRDLKPSNLLISDKSGEGCRLRICDFGLSQVLCRAPPTPGVVTSWYRAPEICCEWTTYGKISDMWSVGCTIFEFCSGVPYLNKVNDNSADVFSAILSIASKPPDSNLISYMFSKGRHLNISGMTVPYRRKSLKERMFLTDDYLRNWNATGGSFDQFADMLQMLLTINPDNRWNATQALEHPFFFQFRNYIRAIRDIYKPELAPLPVIKIVKCIERTWMIRLAFTIYNTHKTDVKNKVWYRHRTMFHAIDLFDQYLEWAFAGNTVLRAHETKMTGCLLTERETNLRFYVCLYLMYKFYSTMSYPLEWTAFAPPEFHTDDQCAIAEEFEMLMVTQVTQYCLYRDTLLEISDQYGHPIDENFIRTLLKGLGEIKEWSDRSVRALYRQIMNVNEQGQPNPVTQKFYMPIVH